MEHMKFVDAVRLAKLWQKSGGNRQVDIAALEPLLWRDGNRRVCDLVSALKDLGFSVGLTTNGHLLSGHAKSLAQSAVDKVRISWHTTSPALFREITATGDYDRFLQGLDAARQAHLPISINRVLLKPYLDDLEHHVQYLSDAGIPLKLYDLLWTPAIASVYAQYYVNAIEATERWLGSVLKVKEMTSSSIGRRRILYHNDDGASVEVKESAEFDREFSPCISCDAKQACLESFGDYVRFEPNRRVYFCYLRRDIGFDASEMLSTGSADAFTANLDRLTEGRAQQFLGASRLRLIAVPVCNFNCGLPGLAASWCHKATGNFTFPARKPVGG